MTYEEIIYDVTDGVATVTMNRPDRMNAMTDRMGGEIRHAVCAASADDEVRVIVLTGAGKGFCAGADNSRLKARASGDMTETVDLPYDGAVPGGLDMPEGYSKKYTYLATATKPVIGAINGAAIGTGFVLALYCDIRFASDTIKMSPMFGRRGLIPEFGMAWLLPKIIGVSKAFDLTYSARIVQAEEAHRIGLVDYVYPADELMEAVRAYATMIAQEVSPRSNRVARELIYKGLTQDVDEAVAHSIEEWIECRESNDFKEGISAWVEKRPARFTGT